MELHPAVAVARQAALLGLPAVAACLATTSAAAPLQPATQACVQLLAQVLAVLQQTSNSSSGSGSSWRSTDGSSTSWRSRGSIGGSSSSSSGNSGLRAARNFPRAHFPFPEEGRWALGAQLPLPQGTSALDASSGSSSWQSYDCWALGEDSSWLGHYNNTSSIKGRHAAAGDPASAGPSDSAAAAAAAAAAAVKQRAYRTLRGAFADGDLLLCLNVPPTWVQGESGFAATRPGVLWHCWQVEATGVQQQQQRVEATGPWQQQQQWDVGQAAESRINSNSSSSNSVSSSSSESAVGGRWSHLYNNNSSGGSSGRNSSSSSSSDSSNSSSSWQVDSHDLFGRTLPSSSYSSRVPSGGNFVGQDNTRKVLNERHSQGTGAVGRFPEGWVAEAQSEGLRSTQTAAVTATAAETAGAAAAVQLDKLPRSFTIQQGTLLNDAAACGDVEAVFGGKAAVTVLQTWPPGHPLSCRDELLLAALDEGEGGLPAWLSIDS